MTIEIIENTLELFEDETFWASWLEITDGVDTYLLPTTAPGTILEGNLQAFYDAKEAELFAVAEQKQLLPEDVFKEVATKRVVKAFSLVVLDEINVIRSAVSLAPRTIAQLRQALKTKLKNL